ncbi:hypothetical protein Tco_0280580, partial [Tanacetum coccineum]
MGAKSLFTIHSSSPSFHPSHTSAMVKAHLVVGFCAKTTHATSTMTPHWNDTLAILKCPQFNQTDEIQALMIEGMNESDQILDEPKRLRNAAWFKDKEMLAEAQESDQILDEEQLASLADLGILDSQAAQTTILNTADFQTEDLDAYDSDCDDVSNAKAVLMANLSNYGSDVISEVPHSGPYHHDM